MGGCGLELCVLLKWRIWKRVDDLEGRRFIVRRVGGRKGFVLLSFPCIDCYTSSKDCLCGILVEMHGRGWGGGGGRALCHSLRTSKQDHHLCGDIPWYDRKHPVLPGWRHSFLGLNSRITIARYLSLPLWISHTSVSASCLSSLPYPSSTPRKMASRSLKMVRSCEYIFPYPILISSHNCTIDQRQSWSKCIDTSWIHLWTFSWIFRTWENKGGYGLKLYIDQPDFCIVLYIVSILSPGQQSHLNPVMNALVQIISFSTNTRRQNKTSQNFLSSRKITQYKSFWQEHFLYCLKRHPFCPTQMLFESYIRKRWTRCQV